MDPMRMMWSAVTRQSRRGKVIGPDERIDRWASLKALTSNAAWQIREEDRKGKIARGMLADLVILDGNPLTVETDKILGIKLEPGSAWGAVPCGTRLVAIGKDGAAPPDAWDVLVGANSRNGMPDLRAPLDSNGCFLGESAGASSSVMFQPRARTPLPGQWPPRCKTFL